MKLLQLGPEDFLTLEENVLRVWVENQKYVYSIESIEKMVLLKTDAGPFYDDMGLAIDTGETVILILSEHNCFQNFLFEQLGQVLPVDYQKVMEATLYAGQNKFVIYEGNKNE